MKPSIVADPTVEPPRTGKWWETLAGSAFVGGLLYEMHRQMYTDSLLWRCIYCDRPVPRPGEPCCKRSQRA